jgi:hypothetical protein
MFDILRTQLAIKLLGRQSTHSIVIAGCDLEKAEIFIDFIQVLQRVFKLIAESLQIARAEGTYPGKIAKMYDAVSIA